VSAESPEWRGPTDENDDTWCLDFEEIEGAATLYVKRTGLKEFDKEAYAVVLHDTVSRNETPVAIDFSGAEAKNLIDDWISMESVGAVRAKILDLRGENR